MIAKYLRKNYLKKHTKIVDFSYFNEYCRSRGGPVLTSEYYLTCMKFHEEPFQLKIFHLDRMDRDI